MVMRSSTGAVDASSLDPLRDPTASALKARASTDPRAAIKTAARQFEALFMQQVMKSMRESSLSSGLLENGGTQLGTEMLDTQYASQMTGIKGGLSELIARQLERGLGSSHATPAAPSTATRGAATALPPAAAAGSAQSGGSPASAQAAFVQSNGAAASAAQAQTGIPASFMIAQAAHESGWGRHLIRNADGSSAHNLFGIKADAGWTGPTATVTTTEVVNGQSHKVSARFRAYASDADSFGDYARMIASNPRYATVVSGAASAAGFAQGLQHAGYATDPAYASKLSKVINTTLRLQQFVASSGGNSA